MSWHFSRALVEEYSVATSSDGALSALSSGNLTPLLYLPSDRMTAFSRLFRFGMTFGPLTDDLGAELLTWFLAGFHARTSAYQVAAKDSTPSRWWGDGNLAKSYRCPWCYCFSLAYCNKCHFPAIKPRSNADPGFATHFQDDSAGFQTMMRTCGLTELLGEIG